MDTTRVRPRLVTVAGPLKGMVIALTEEELSLGRDGSNRLRIADGALSRRHGLHLSCRQIMIIYVQLKDGPWSFSIGRRS